MKVLEVVCAVIQKDDKIFIAQRGYGDYKDGWEFPGGKKEEKESYEQALIREIQEELHASIKIEKKIGVFIKDYPTFIMHMHAYLCTLQSEYTLLEHEDAKWVKLQEVDISSLLPVDQDIFRKIENFYQ